MIYFRCGNTINIDGRMNCVKTRVSISCWNSVSAYFVRC